MTEHPSTVSGIFHQPFAEQVAFFLGKLDDLRPTEKWNDLWQHEHDKAFMVAGAAKADLLADLASAVRSAIENGTGLEEFRSSFAATVQKYGWKNYTGDFGWRTKLIYNTNANTSYAAGRLAQLQNFPFWIYRHSDSVLHPRPHHVALDGLTLPQDHPFWKTHYPPNGWGCNCFVVGADDMELAEMLGGTDRQLPDGWDKRDENGLLSGIDKSWDYQPGRSVTDFVRLQAEKLASLPAQIGASFGKDVPCELPWKEWAENVFFGTRHDSGALGAFTSSEIATLKAIGKEPATAGIFVRPGLVKGKKADRHWKAKDGLTLQDWKNLPSLFGQAKLTYLDTQSGNIVFVLGADERRIQLSCQIDFFVKKIKSYQNQCVSCYMVDFKTVEGRILGGELIPLKENKE